MEAELAKLRINTYASAVSHGKPLNDPTPNDRCRNLILTGIRESPNENLAATFNTVCSEIGGYFTKDDVNGLRRLRTKGVPR